MSDSYPVEVEGLHRALLRIPGVIRADTGITGVERLTPDELALPELADLPHAAIRRSTAQRGEAVVQVELELERSERGWKGLEFIAWATKDLSRSGEPVQLRPIGLPPIAQGRVQLGQTLRFVLDIFVLLDGSAAPALDKLAELTVYFDKYVELYGDALSA